jgi:hypothetical protein
VIVELQEQLLAQERELDSRDGTAITWEESLMTFAHEVSEASAECNAIRACAATTQWDIST